MHASHGHGPLSAGFRRFAAAGGCHMARPGRPDYLAILLFSAPLPHCMPRREADWHRQLGCAGGRCGACALVGNAWHLLGADMGAEIDSYAVVVRFGAAAPTEGVEADVGARTSLRVVVRAAPARPRAARCCSCSVGSRLQDAYAADAASAPRLCCSTMLLHHAGRNPVGSAR